MLKLGFVNVRKNDRLDGVTVIFDLDGTLVDTAGDLGEAMNVSLASIGAASVPKSKVRHLVGRGARVMLAHGYKLGEGKAPTDALLDEAFAVFLDYYERNIAEESRPFDGVLDLMDGLIVRGATMAICTNKREKLARHLIRTLEIDQYFGVVVGADTLPVKKPDPAPVRHCLEVTRAQRSVFIGDSDTDILAATAADVPCLVATFGYGPLEQLSLAAGQFDRYADAASLIETLVSKRN